MAAIFDKPVVIQMIDINKLNHHPNNPRKNIGDVTELADSIRQKGIMQNLTVIPWFSTITNKPCDNAKDQEKMGYYVVIGNRRLAAAKTVGLTELPCVISDMTFDEQITTMLAENMQRSDLTVLEEAQGFQMLLDLGDSVESVAEKTGISKATVRKRLKLTELDQNILKERIEKSEGQISLKDLDKLNQIEDIKQRNKLLGLLSTSNFAYEINRAVEAQHKEKNKKQWIKELSRFAVQLKERNYNKYETIKYCHFKREFKEEDIPQDSKETEYFFYVDNWGLVLMKERTVTEEQTAAQREREEKLASEKQTREMFKEIAKTAYKLRGDFIKNCSSIYIKRYIKDIAKALVNAISEEYYLDEKAGDYIVEIADKSTERVLLYLLFALFDDDAELCMSWECKYMENEKLFAMYDLLEKLGYKKSNEESAFLDGSHKMYVKGKEQ